MLGADILLGDLSRPGLFGGCPGLVPAVEAAQLRDGGLDIRHILVSGLGIIPGADRGGSAGGLTDTHNAALGPVGAVGLAGAGDAAAGEDQTVNVLGHQAAVGNAIGIQGHLPHAAVAVAGGAVGVVQVDGEIAPGNLVLEFPAVVDIAAGEGVLALDVPGLPDTYLRAGGADKGMLKAGHILDHEFGHRVDLAASVQLALRPLDHIRGVQAADPGGVEVHGAGMDAVEDNDGVSAEAQVPGLHGLLHQLLEALTHEVFLL